MPNLLDSVGLLSIITYLLVESHDGTMTTCLIIGLFCIFYRGIMSLSLIYDKFMISIKLIKNSIMDMIPFAVILGTQILLFATLNSIKQLADIYEDESEQATGYQVLRANSFNQLMLILGGPKPQIKYDDTIRWALYIAYAFLMNIVNMKLLISVIGETYAKHQLSRVPMSYNMKVNYLLELSKLRNKLRIYK